MSPRTTSIVLTVALFWLAAVPARAARVDLLTDARAADVLSDLLTYASDRTEASNNAMQAYLKQIGKDEDYAKNKPVVSRDGMSFTSIFKAAVIFVKEGGDKYADPTLKELGKDALLDEMTESQSYNLQVFMKLNQQRDANESMRTYLKSIGEFDKFVAWANQNAPTAVLAGPATQPAAKTPEELAKRMAALTEYARSIAWRKAEARGVSQADFDAEWAKRVAAYKDQVADKVEGVRALGGTLAKSEITGTRQDAPAAMSPTPTQPLGPIPPPAIWTAQPPIRQAERELPKPVESKNTPEHFQQLNNQNSWNPWDGQWYNNGVPLGR